MPFLRIPTLVVHTADDGVETQEETEFVIQLENVAVCVPTNEGWTNLSFVNGLQLTIRIRFDEWQDWLEYISIQCPETKMFSWPYKGES